MSSQNHHFNNVIIASGPVIIENGKVLVNKHGEKNIWKFPGGDITESSGNLEEWAKRKVKEEMGVEIRILRPLKPTVIWQENETIILIHYLAELVNSEIKPADYIKEWTWLEINNLPPDCAPNIQPIIDEYKQINFDI